MVVQVERVRAELSRVQTQAQLAAEARANAAVAKATKMGNLVPKSEMEVDLCALLLLFG